MGPTVFRESSERNKRPILEKLLALLPSEGTALEIASGTGQHVEWFAQHMPGWVWQPTDVDDEAVSVINARMAQSKLCNVRAAEQLDVIESPWSIATPVAPTFDVIYCCNMLHAAPYETCKGLMQGSASHLADGGVLVIYGPFFESGQTPTPSNVEFDSALRARDPRRGIRWIHDLELEAYRLGLALQSRIAMPSNNMLLVWGRQ